MKKRFKLIAALSISMMMAGFAGCGSSAKNTSAKSDAKKEITGSITLYTSQPDSDAQTLIKAFEAKYKGVKVNVFRSGTEQVVSKLLSEKQANAVQADVLLISDAGTFESLKNKGLLMKYKSPETTGIPSEFIDKDNTYTGTKIISTGIIVNTNNVKSDIKTWSDFSSDAYKNKTVMPSPLYSGAAAYNVSVFTRTKGIGWDFYNSLKKNNVMIEQGNGSILTDVAKGKKDMGMIVDYMAVKAQNQGSPVKFVYPKDGVPAITEPVGIVKSTKNVDASKAFVDFILSKEGQNVESSIGYTPVKSGATVPKGLKSFKEMKVLNIDIKQIVKNEESDKNKFSDIFK